jgi:hypothetical protein
MKGEAVFARPLLALASAALMAACAVGPSPSPTPTAVPGAVALRTQEPQPAGTAAACMAALITGTLVRDAHSGVGVRDDQGLPRQVVWPNGYSARDDAGRLALIDPIGRVSAHEGDHVSIGGGEIDGQGTWLACGGTHVVAP